MCCGVLMVDSVVALKASEARLNFFWRTEMRKACATVERR